MLVIFASSVVVGASLVTLFTAPERIFENKAGLSSGEITPQAAFSRISSSPDTAIAGVSGEQALVRRVIDGDTIELSDGKKVRYIGIDTPETVDPHSSTQ